MRWLLLTAYLAAACAATYAEMRASHPPAAAAVQVVPEEPLCPWRPCSQAETRITVVRRPDGRRDILVAEWRRATPGEVEQTGVNVWRFRGERWQIALRYRSSTFEPYVEARMSDVTGDGRLDLLLDRVSGGSGDCGTRSVFAWLHYRLRRVYARSFCHGAIDARAGRLVESLAVGPCPHRPSSVHCFGGTTATVFRLERGRLVPARRTVTCALPSLDPSRECRPRD